MRKPLLTAALLVSTAAVAVGATQAFSYFLGAGAGTAVAFEPVALPQPTAVPHPPGGPGVLQVLWLKSAFSPTLHQLLQGETVITSDVQMREVWRRLFSEPYDASLFDFQDSFVVLMGGGSLVNGSFDISAVERVEAEYSEPGGFGGRGTVEAFLSVTATTFLSGVQQQDPPPATWRVSAVKVPREAFDDVVFRRNLMLGM